MSRVTAPAFAAFPTLLERRTTAVAITEWALALVPLAFFLAGLIVPK